MISSRITRFLPRSLLIARRSLLVGLFASSLLGAAAAQAQSTKPANWPAGTTWYAYDQAVSLPTRDAPLRIRYVQPGRGVGGVGGFDSIRFDTLPTQYAIARVHGTGERKIAVFADPSCPYSQQLEKVLNKLPNVTIYTFVAPLLGPSSMDRINQILCQPTGTARAQAYDAWMLAKQTPQVVAPCSNTAKAVLQSISGLVTSNGKAMSTVSPTLVFSNNIVMGGALTADQVSMVMKLPNQ